MIANSSPLRYPGGKSKMYRFVKEIIVKNNLNNSIYVEPFAGGYGLGLCLLCNEDLKHFIINDYDFHIYAFWKTLFNYTEDLIKFINEVTIDIYEWEKQKNIYNNYNNYSVIEVGCATLFLNRTNYSGILTSGPIGGFEQAGKYKISCRFNKKSLIERIMTLSKYKKRVEVFNLDAINLIKKLKPYEKNIFYNFDPPYVEKGPTLYLNSFSEVDHRNLKDAVRKINSKWIMTYDNSPLIKDLYKDLFISQLTLDYSINNKRKGSELIISNFQLD